MPTPDTLRAAIEQVILDLGPMADNAGHVSIALMRDLQHTAGTLTAALAAPAAPTDTPDEREPKPCPKCGRTCTYDGWDHVHPDGLGIGSCSPAAPTDTPDERCGAHWGYDNPRPDHAMHRCERTGNHGLRHRCACGATADEVGGERTEPTDSPDERRPMERPREFDVDHDPVTVHAFVEAPDDAASMGGSQEVDVHDQMKAHDEHHATRLPAVTAPREDERTHRVTTFTSEDGVEMRALTREAPAVERATPDTAWHHLADQLEHTANQPHVDTSLGDGYRAGLQEAADAIREQADTTRATPDPDTLAEALFEISMRLQGVIHGGWGSLTSEQHRFWHEQARPILIAAGVTLNQPGAGA